MKARLAWCIVFICVALIFGTFSPAKADTLLFPVIATNYPYVITIVSVVNEGPSSTHLRYVYHYKSAASGYSSGCNSASFVRPTSAPDLVSFDASGTFNGGGALFNDPDNYGGGFALGASGANRGYLLVTNSDSVGNRLDVGSNYSLRGEAIVMDIMYGAAWGYRAVNDIMREDFSFLPIIDGGGLLNMIYSGGGHSRFAFFPPAEWTTKFFVTPIGLNMDISNLTSTVRLYASSGVAGINSRGITIYSFNVPQTATCTAAINLSDLIDSSAWSAIYYTGGWGRFGVSAGSSAIVYKLEYVVNNPTYGGTNNNAYLMSVLD